MFLDIPGSGGSHGCPQLSPQPTPAPVPASSGVGTAGVGTETQGKPERMPNYDGKSSWSDYLVQFEIAEVNHWSLKQKAMDLVQAC